MKTPFHPFNSSLVWQRVAVRDVLLPSSRPLRVPGRKANIVASSAYQDPVICVWNVGVKAGASRLLTRVNCGHAVFSFRWLAPTRLVVGMRQVMCCINLAATTAAPEGDSSASDAEDGAGHGVGDTLDSTSQAGESLEAWNGSVERIWLGGEGTLHVEVATDDTVLAACKRSHKVLCAAIGPHDGT